MRLRIVFVSFVVITLLGGLLIGLSVFMKPVLDMERPQIVPPDIAGNRFLEYLEYEPASNRSFAARTIGPFFYKHSADIQLNYGGMKLHNRSDRAIAYIAACVYSATERLSGNQPMPDFDIGDPYYYEFDLLKAGKCDEALLPGQEVNLTIKLSYQVPTSYLSKPMEIGILGISLVDGIPVETPTSTPQPSLPDLILGRDR